VVRARSVICFVESSDAITAGKGASLCGLAGGLSEETLLAVATGVDFLALRALKAGDLVRRLGFVAIFLSFLGSAYHLLRATVAALRLRSAGNKRKGLHIPVAVGHLVN
jgi:hypothetical protein